MIVLIEIPRCAEQPWGDSHERDHRRGRVALIKRRPRDADGYHRMQMTPGPFPADAGDARVFRMPVVYRLVGSVVLGVMSVFGLVTVARRMIDDHAVFVPLIVFLAVVAVIWWQVLMVQPIEIRVFADGRLELGCALRTRRLHVQDVRTVRFSNQRLTIRFSGRRLSPIVSDARGLALTLVEANPMIRTLGRPIVLIDAERQHANQRFGRWMLVPWSVALVGGVGVSAILGNERVGKWLFLGGWLVAMPMMIIAIRRER